MKANRGRIKANLVYPELSYQLMAILFKVHNRLGPNFQEKYYQKAIEIELKEQGIEFEKERLVGLTYGTQPLGKYFIDFVIDDKIALEVKASNYFSRSFNTQVLAYLNSANLKLGIIVNFNANKLLYKRLINPKFKN